VKYGAIYFALVFGAGFVLGPIRILWLVPRVGERIAELIEAPIMLVVIVVVARWVVHRLGAAAPRAERLAVGLIALALLLIFEFAVVLGLRGLTVAEYVAGRDPVARVVYLVMLGLFAAMPLAVVRRTKTATPKTAGPK
jgi:hypothetical protein